MVIATPDAGLTQGRRSEQLSSLRAMMAQGTGRDASVEAERLAWEESVRHRPDPAGVSISSDNLGGVPAERLRRVDEADPTLLYLHGGSYTAGSPRTHRHMLARLARAGLDVWVPDYRLAPEHPMPAALNDALAAYQDLATRSRSRISVAGDSSGGGLAVSTLMAARDAGLAMPKNLACFSPWLDLTCSSPAYEDNQPSDFVLDRSRLRRSAAAYLAGVDPRDPRASPMFGDWSGLPPVLIQTGGAELFLDDALGGARAAAVAGVHVTLELWPDMPHGFQVLADALDDGALAVARAAAWMLS